MADQRVGERYRLVSLAGAGGMGEVWYALDETNGEPVAIKLLLLPSSLARSRFDNEIRLLEEASHPAIVAYRAHGDDPARGPWLAMEWVEGKPLDRRLEEGPLAVDDALGMAMALADGLATLHARGVVHRDLKPENVILLGGDPRRPKLVDFGVAVAPGARHTKPGMVVGTPGYIAPEQVRGEAVDARSDVFGLGALLYEALTAEAAFVAEHPLATITKILLEDPTPVRELCPDVSEALGDLVASLLAKDPDERPRNAAEVAEILRELRAGGPATVVKITLPRVGDREARMLSLLVGQRGSGDDQTLDDMAVAEERARLDEVAARFGATVELATSTSFAVSVPRGPVGTDAPRRAVRCGLALRAALPDYSMAVATARAGSAEAGAIGETIERATRLLPADPSEALAVDDATEALLDGRFVVAGAQGALRVLEERAGPPLPRSRGTGALFVGRDRELASLGALYAEAVEQTVPRVAIVVAEGGAGKSRLALELLHRIEPPSSLAWAQADALRSHVPFAVAAQLLAPLLGLELPLTREALDEAIAGLFPPGELRDAAALHLPELFGLVTRDRASIAAETDPALLAAQVRRAALAVVDELTARGPLTLVVDDAHYADEPSVRLLDELLRETLRAPVLVLALALPELDARHPGIFSRRAPLRVALAPLANEAASALVRATLPSANDSTLRAITEQAEGNPFHLEELARAYGEGATHCDSLLSMVEAHIARLPPDARRVLRAGSVFGDRFDADGVRHLLALPAGDSEWAQSLRAVVEAELLVPEERAGGHRFRHRLAREAAYAMLTDEDRAIGHRLAAEWLADRDEARAEEIASHLERAGRPTEAVRWLTRAAREALRGNDLQGALRFAERGLAAGESPDVGRLYRVAAQARVWLGRTAEALDAAEKALARTPHGSPDYLWAASVAAVAAGGCGLPERLAQIARELERIEPTRENLPPLALALTRAANQLFFSGRYELGKRTLERVEAVLEGVSDPAAEARLAQVRGIAASHAGDHATLLSSMRRASRLFEVAGDRRSTCVCLVNLGAALGAVGLFDEAIEVLRRGLKTSEELELGVIAVPVRLNLASPLLSRGDADEAARLAEEALLLVEGTGDVRLEGASRIWWARALAALGRGAEARAQLDRAIPTLDTVPAYLALGLAMRALLSAREGDAGAALTDSGRAIAILDELGTLQEGEELVYLARLEALRAAGSVEEARAMAARTERWLDARLAGLNDELREAVERIPEHQMLRRIGHELLA